MRKTVFTGYYAQQIKRTYDDAHQSLTKKILKDSKITDEEFNELSEHFSDCAKNPYVIFWHLLLKGYGVEDLNLIQKFYKFDQGIVGIPFSDIHLKNGKVSIPRNNSTYIDWLPLEHYLRWLEKNKSQRAMVNELYRWAKKGINQEMYDTLSQFAQYETALPESLRQMLLRRGLTREVHDLISEAVLELNPNTRNRILLYTPEDYALEYQIGDYEFRLVRQTHDLSIIGRQMHNCVASYREQALFGESIIMTAKKDGNYVICIELDAEHHLYQAYGPHNQELSGDNLIACGAWIKRCQIQISTLWFHLGDTSEADGWKISKLPTEEILPKMTRDEISRVTKNGVSYGYYSSMAAVQTLFPSGKTYCKYSRSEAKVFHGGAEMQYGRFSSRMTAMEE